MLHHAFSTQADISAPYGGFINTRPVHFRLNPSCTRVKYRGHLALRSSAHGSNVNPNSVFNRSNNQSGVDQLSVADDINCLYPRMGLDSNRLLRDLSRIESPTFYNFFLCGHGTRKQRGCRAWTPQTIQPMDRANNAGQAPTSRTNACRSASVPASYNSYYVRVL